MSMGDDRLRAVPAALHLRQASGGDFGIGSPVHFVRVAIWRHA